MRNETICAAAGWNTGSETGSRAAGGVLLSCFKGFAPSGKTRYGELHGVRFATHEACDAAAIERGYSSIYRGGPKCFIRLRLPRRARAFLRTLAAAERPARISAMLPERDREFFGQFMNASYGADRIGEWMQQAIATRTPKR